MPYTLIRQDSDTLWSGLDLEDAAREIIGYGGYDFEIHKDGDGLGYTLWRARWSRRSTEFKDPTLSAFVKTAFYVGSGYNEEQAAQAIYQKVVDNAEMFSGQRCVTDEAYAQELRDTVAVLMAEPAAESTNVVHFADYKKR